MGNFCIACGEKRALGARFCGNCGTQVVDDSQSGHPGAEIVGAQEARQVERESKGSAEGMQTHEMTERGLTLMEQGDVDGALSWWQRAAVAGDPNAMTNLGNELGSRGDLNGARPWWERAAQAGNTQAMFNLGVLLEMSGDIRGARAWYELSAEEGYALAMTNLSNLLSELGDSDGALQWAIRAAEAGVEVEPVIIDLQ